MRRYALSAVISSFAVILLFLCGCSEDVFLQQPKPNMAPVVWLSSGPVEGTTTGYQVHFYWGGWDPDGEVAFYEFVVVDAEDYGFNPEDTTGLDKWYRTTAHDSVFKVSADDSMANVTIGNNDYTYYDRMHTFFLRGVDLQGMRSELVESRSFTAWTLAPYVTITRPPQNDVYSRVIKFVWSGYDPIDVPSNTQDPVAIRYMFMHLVDTNGVYNPQFDILSDMNRNPRRYADKWKPWISYTAPEDSGKSTIIGDDETPIYVGDYHIFAVQAMDDAGAVTGIFSASNNFRKFIISERNPTLTVTEYFIGSFVFIGRNFRPIKRDLPPGVPLRFSWRATAEDYGGEISGYRYGWDIADVNNPADWPTTFNPRNTAAPVRYLYSGTHTFFVEVIDNSQFTTLAQIQINVIPFSMERSLLWVDDFYSEDFIQKDYVMPTETEHDLFWLDICSRAVGFEADIDVYDAARKNFKPAPITTIGKYKNMIWTYSSSPNQSTWHTIVVFTPESFLTTGTQLTVNYISLFLAKGGHLWSLGRSDKTGGIAATLVQQAWNFPMNLKCEIAGPEVGCEGDTSGVNSMGYKDYCITMLDKIDGPIRQDEDMPTRTLKRYDVLSYALRADDDPITFAHPEIPPRLDMWATAVAPGTFWYPLNPVGPGGFTYVEIYDPQYWMDLKFVENQSCFHPLFRMKAYNSRSALNNTTIALWLTKYADIVPDIPPEYPQGVAAPSFQFGFPLWFFDRGQGNAIVNLIFTKWGIRASP